MEIYLSIFKEIKYLDSKSNLKKSSKAVNGHRKEGQMQLIKVQTLIRV
jgi:hypothetical protein